MDDSGNISLNNNGAMFVNNEDNYNYIIESIKKII